MLCDYHVHSVFSDGKDTPEEIVKTAIEKGFSEIGFSDHSYTDFDESYCIPKARLREYEECIRELSEKYKDRIKILFGVEQDYYSETPTDGYDYIIGSLHYVKVNDVYIPVDESPETLEKAAKEYFGGDMLSLCEEYYKTVAKVCEKTKCDMIGHFDLVTKYIEKKDLFSTESKRYRKAALDAASELLKSGKPFEINTGAISRGHRTTPYPQDFIMKYLSDNGAEFVLSSDSHRKENIGYYFDKTDGSSIRIRKQLL